MVGTTLAEGIEAISDAIEAKITAATAEEELLHGIKSVERYEAIRGKPQPPILWMIADTATIAGDSTTFREVWRLPVALIAVTQDSHNPRQGQAAATRYATNARSVVLADRSLGIDYVSSVQSSAFEPRTKFPDEGGKFSAGTIIEVYFVIYE